MKKSRKVFFLLLFTASMITSSCWLPDCKDYLDFDTMLITQWGTEAGPFEDTLTMGDTLAFQFYMDGYEAIACQETNWSPMPTMHATSPCDQLSGMKWPVMEFHLVTVGDFDANHPAGSNLDDLTYISHAHNFAGPQYRLDSAAIHDPDSSTFRRYPEEYLYRLESSPDSIGSYEFIFSLLKANGEVVEQRFGPVHYK